eukprot:gene24041-52046_t
MRRAARSVARLLLVATPLPRPTACVDCSDDPHPIDAGNGYTCAQRLSWSPGGDCGSWYSDYCCQTCWNCNLAICHWT